MDQKEEIREYEKTLTIEQVRNLRNALVPRCARRKILGDTQDQGAELEDLLAYTTQIFESRLLDLFNEFLAAAKDDDSITINIEPFQPSS